MSIQKVEIRNPKMNMRIRELRMELNYKQGEFAEKLMIKQGSLCDIENMRVNVSPRVVRDLERIFNVNTDWLENGIGEKFNPIIAEDEYMRIVTEIGVKDEKSRQMILKYWSLNSEDKTLFMNFVDRLSQ